ncbi:hypothetical protein F4212_09220 [Candidatus Poribacteria bacterium]|nr:hypothetical protein [Candidatus Poribacteria bacterium]
MPNPKPAPLNFTPNDPTGAKWALPEGAIARLGKGYQDYSSDSEIALSPDSTFFAIGTRIGIWWYNVSSMSPIALWETERGMISAVDISPDGKLIAFSNWDGIVKVRDIQSGECISQINRSEIHKTNGHITFSPNSHWIAIVNRGGVVEILDVQSGQCITQIEQESNEQQTNYISKLRFSPDGQYIAATIGKQIYLWNPTAGTIIAKFTGRIIAFSPDSRWLAYENSYKIHNPTSVPFASDVSVWDIVSGERIAHFTEHKELVKVIKFSPCGQFLVSSDTSRVLHVWNLKKRALKETHEDYGRPFYLQDGTLLATVFTRGTIEVWDVEEREKLQTYELPVESIGYKWFSKCPELVIAHALSNKLTISEKTQTFSTLHEPICFPRKIQFIDGEALALRGNTQDIVLWNIKNNQKQRISYQSEFNESIRSFTVLPGGDILVVNWSSNTNVYKVIKLSNTKEMPIAKFTPTTQLGNDTFTFSDECIAFGGKSGVIYLWDLRHSKVPRQFIGHTEHVQSLAFSPDGKRLVSGASDKSVRLWDVVTSEEITTLPLNKPFFPKALAYSPCGKVIAGGMIREINIWCAEKLQLLISIPHNEDSIRPFALAFSPCGRYLSSGTWWDKGMEKMSIRLWNVETGENIHTFWGHTTDIEILTFSPNSSTLASGSFDGTALLWDLTTIIDR